MSTYLELSQFCRQECSIPGIGPSGVAGQIGVLGKIVKWVKDGYVDIQNRHDDWRWMRVGFTVDTTISDSTYAFGDCIDVETGVAIARFKRWWANDLYYPFKCYLTSGGVGGEYRLNYLPWNDFRQLYNIGTQTDGQPSHISIDNQDRFVLGPAPNAVYTVTGDFQRGVQVLAADEDVPDMPASFHDLIVYYGMEKYGADSIAIEVYQRAKTEGKRMLRALERNQLPEFVMAEPMA
jgi:hypothetical protein